MQNQTWIDVTMTLGHERHTSLARITARSIDYIYIEQYTTQEFRLWLSTRGGQMHSTARFDNPDAAQAAAENLIHSKLNGREWIPVEPRGHGGPTAGAWMAADTIESIQVVRETVREPATYRYWIWLGARWDHIPAQENGRWVSRIGPFESPETATDTATQVQAAIDNGASLEA